MSSKGIEIMDISRDAWTQEYVKTHVPAYIYGRDMQDRIVNSVFLDKETWAFPEGVKENIKDDELYLVWFVWQDSADMRNESVKNKVIYIEKVPDYIEQAIILKENLEKEIDKYSKRHKTIL